MTSCYFLLVIAFSFIFSANAGHSSGECVYSFYVKTGTFIKAGTNSKISVTLGDKSENSVEISELRSGGLMGPDHNYFEIGNLDMFSVTGWCLKPPLCRLNVTSDGSGQYPGWFCEFIEVTFTGPHKPCSQSFFYVEQWLVRPDELTAVFDACARDDLKHRPFVVRNPRAGSASQ